MEETQTQKIKALYVLKILKECSDDKHPITQGEICEKLKKYGIVCDRKTVSRCIDGLIDFGYDIVRILGGGCYYIDDTFDDSEIAFLVDCVYSSPAISQKQAESIITRLTANISNENKKKFKNIFKASEMIRTENRQVFYNIDKINEAILTNKQIAFNYNTYSKDKKLRPRKQEKYIINPYFTINSKGKYFLVCNKDNYDNISNYRIDYMTYIDILDTPRKDISLVKDGSQVFSPTKYANEHIYMFAGESKNFILRLYNERVVGDIVDWFGKSVKIFEQDGNTLAEVKTNENAMIYWALQYGEDVEIIEPLETREKIKNILKDMVKKYE